MAFKKTLPPQVVPDSPDSILLDLPRRKIPGLLHHQGEVIKSYVSKAVDEPDVALQLPTGSGKTLVGLLIGEWRRRKFKEKVLYLCPTRQLVNQAVEQANENYGLTVNGFVGKATDYSPAIKAEYNNAQKLAISTYSSLFNTNPFFGDPDVIIIDDAHTSESYISSLWSFRVERGNPLHASLHTAISNIIHPKISHRDYLRLMGQINDASDVNWVDKIPTPSFIQMIDELTSVIDVHVGGNDIRYQWLMIKDHLHACHLYMTSKEILIRPLIPPTWNHRSFHAAKRRIFMSATLGVGGDLERLTGRKNIFRLPIPDEWNRHGIGRRFFVFPEMSLTSNETSELRNQLIKLSGRSIVLVPSENDANKILAEISVGNVGAKMFRASDIEKSKAGFVSESNAVALISGRYDGIDFPGDDCRLVFIEGLPNTVNAQERFIMSKMGANILFNERIQTRVLQAIGRCTRSMQDYSAVVVAGENIPEYLSNRERRSYLHPELQAEIEFGIEQSTGVTTEDILENISIFLKNDFEWEQANEQILSRRGAAVQEVFPAVADLQNIVVYELQYQEHLWNCDYELALEKAEKVLAGLDDERLRGYRAVWHYLAGSSAWLGAEKGNVDSLYRKASQHFGKAKKATSSISWLINLSKYQEKTSEKAEKENTSIYLQIERLEQTLNNLGILNDRKFAKREKQILDGIKSVDQFELAHKSLGDLLGFEAGKEESDASPDPWWISGEFCLVFEDHAGAKITSILDATKARQASSHPNWIKEKGLFVDDMKILPVLISPVQKATIGARPHLQNVALWPLDDFRQWAIDALRIIRELRLTFSQPGDLEWRTNAAEKLLANKLDAQSLMIFLEGSLAVNKLNFEG